MTDAPSRLLPVEDDHDTAGFWEAARRHELVVRVCDSCGTPLHVPIAYCNNCGSMETHWQQVAGRGRLYSWTVIEHQIHPAYPVPHALVLVELEDYPSVRLLGMIPGDPELVEGQSMEVWWEELDEGVVLPQWRPA